MYFTFLESKILEFDIIYKRRNSNDGTSFKLTGFFLSFFSFIVRDMSAETETLCPKETESWMEYVRSGKRQHINSHFFVLFYFGDFVALGEKNACIKEKEKPAAKAQSQEEDKVREPTYCGSMGQKKL